MNTYDIFKDKYCPEIMDMIKTQHETHRNLNGMHGFSHIARCIILTKALCEIHNLPEDERMQCFIAIGLHDVCREDDGEDLWESQSGEKAKEFALKHNFSKEFAETVFELVVNKTSHKTLNKQFSVCHDADCLDIIRCVQQHFIAEKLVCADLLLNEKLENPNDIDPLSKLIYDATKLINWTDDIYESVYSFNQIEDLILSDWNNDFKLITNLIEI